MIVSVDEFGPWLSGQLERFVRPATGKGRKLIDEAARALEEGKGFYLDLSRKGDKDMGSKHDPVSYRAARVLGHSSRQGVEMASKVPVPGEVSWESLRSLKDSLSSTGKSLKELRGRAQGEMSGLYILDMRSFGGVGDRIAKSGERLAGFLEAEGGSLQKARTLTSVSAALEQAVQESRSLEKELEGLLSERHRVSGNVQNLDAEFRKQTGEGNVGLVLGIERDLRRESREFRSTTLAHLQRPLRRLGELSQRGEVPMDVDQREALGRFVVGPYRTLLSSGTGPLLKPILENLRKAMDSGKLGFKPRKASRVRAQLDELVSGDVLEVKRTHGRGLLSKRKVLLQDDECRRLYVARKETMSRLEGEKGVLEDVLEREKVLREKLRLASQRVDEVVRQAETRTKEFLGVDVRIERPKILVGAQ